MKPVSDGIFIRVVFNMNLYGTYFHLYDSLPDFFFIILARGNLWIILNGFNTWSSTCCFIISHFYPLLPFMSCCTFTCLHSCSPPPSRCGRPGGSLSLSRLHWPNADDRRGSVAPWGLIMDNPSCFTIDKLRLLRFKHVFIPIPCSFLFLLLFCF